MASKQKVYTLVGVLEREGLAALAVKVREQTRLGWIPYGEIHRTTEEDLAEGYEPMIAQYLYQFAKPSRFETAPERIIGG